MTRKNVAQVLIVAALLAGMLYVCSGCARLQYETRDGTRVTYTRLFTTSDSIKGNVGEARIAVTKQEINTTIAEALLKLLTAAK